MGKKNEIDYERIGRDLLAIAETGYANKKRLMAISFYKGLATGLGSIIGATVGIALLLFVLSLLGEIPFVGRIAESISNTIDSNL